MENRSQNFDAGLAIGVEKRFRRPLMSYFMRRVRDYYEAEDLTQQTFLRLLSSGHKHQIERTEAYVFTIASNLLRDRSRRMVRNAASVSPTPDAYAIAELAGEFSEDRSPERVLLGRETLADVLRTLGELGELTRDIFILFRLENMKHREIAALYGIGQSTVEKHVMKATLHLALRYGRAD